MVNRVFMVSPCGDAQKMLDALAFLRVAAAMRHR
jgi:hypothetical protein